MSFVVEWFWSFMHSLGFYNKSASILILGLDNAGKTTLLYRLKTGQINSFIPTQRANIEEFVCAVPRLRLPTAFCSRSTRRRRVVQPTESARLRLQEFGGTSFKAFDVGGVLAHVGCYSCVAVLTTLCAAVHENQATRPSGSCGPTS